jgi:hypothetical protein
LGLVNVAGLRFFDISNVDATTSPSASGAIMRLITRNTANTGNTSADFVRYNNGPLFIANHDGGATLFVNSGSERMRINGTGVGIGGVNPGFLLDVAGGNGEIARFASGSTSNDAFIRVREGSGNEDAVLGSTTGVGFVGSSTNNAFSVRSNNAERMRFKTTGAIRFVPLAADPSTGNEAGDVYYNSSTNKLRVYNGTTWVDLH